MVCVCGLLKTRGEAPSGTRRNSLARVWVTQVPCQTPQQGRCTSIDRAQKESRWISDVGYPISFVVLSERAQTIEVRDGGGCEIATDGRCVFEEGSSVVAVKAVLDSEDAFC